MAPSRAKAQVQREAAVVQPMPQRRARTSRGTQRPIAAPGEPTADLMMAGTGCWARTSSLMSGMTKTRGMRKRRPAKVLMKMVATMALGTWVEGSRTSSHMEMIMPVDEVA
ncbi:hypothetical protein HYQ46_009362 [Verticillium longisporum]|nr:hypothetical protein HYQ46_009362 [Verticillium longisporum]